MWVYNEESSTDYPNIMDIDRNIKVSIYALKCLEYGYLGDFQKKRAEYAKRILGIYFINLFNPTREELNLFDFEFGYGSSDNYIKFLEMYNSYSYKNITFS